jgi:hypothetical protein
MEIKRTKVAEEAVSCSDLFAVSVGQLRVQGTCEFAPVLKTPEGVSTAGGQLARQHITLNPAVPSEASVTVGWVDVARKQSLLRNFARLEQIHKERTPGRAFPVDAKSYEAFFEQAHKFLSRTGLSPVVEAPGATLTEHTKPSPPKGTGRTAALAMLAIAIVGLLIVMLIAAL